MLLDSAGDRAGALTEYERYAKRLHVEYGADPAPETKALIEEIRATLPELPWVRRASVRRVWPDGRITTAAGTRVVEEAVVGHDEGVEVVVQPFLRGHRGHLRAHVGDARLHAPAVHLARGDVVALADHVIRHLQFACCRRRADHDVREERAVDDVGLVLVGEFADHFGLKDPNKVALAWIVDFPFYERSETTGQVDFGHNPFSMPKGGIEAIRAASSDEQKLAILADQYDMVMNGYEICSGGVRNHNPEVLYEVFAVLGYDKKYVEEKFGAMLSAFKFGAPPHAGCAFGVDRMFMELMSEDNIREVIAFPKNGSGVDVMMNSPSHVDVAQKKELGLS